MKKHSVKFKSGLMVVLEIYLWAALVWITYGLVAPVALWRVLTRIASKAEIIEDDTK